MNVNLNIQIELIEYMNDIQNRNKSQVNEDHMVY